MEGLVHPLYKGYNGKARMRGAIWLSNSIRNSQNHQEKIWDQGLNDLTDYCGHIRKQCCCSTQIMLDISKNIVDKKITFLQWTGW